MEFDLQTILYEVDSIIHDGVTRMISQTLLYGVYLCLAPIAIHAMVTNGLQSRARKWLFTITTSMFALTTVHWIFSTAVTLLSIDSCSSSIIECQGYDNASFCILSKLPKICPRSIAWLEIFSDVLYINYIIADGVVVWRACVLCSDQRRTVLMIPVVMLAINTVIYLIFVVAGAVEIFFSKGAGQVFNTTNIIQGLTQVAQPVLSSLINIFATSIIALKAWKYRKLLKESGIGIRTPRQAIRILALLVESGMIYIMFGVAIVVCIFLFAHFNLDMVSAQVMLVGLQLIGIYPVTVILLVEKNRSLDSAFRSFGTIIDARGDQTSQVEPMAFVSGLVLGSGDAGIGGSSKASKVPNEEHAIS